MNVAKTGNISPLDPTAAAAFYRQIYDRFRGAIASGVLKPGDRLPSARALTKELGLARGTIEVPGLKPRTPVANAVPSPNRGIAVVSFRPESILPFQMGLPALDVFPRKIWARLGAQCGREIGRASC